MICPKCGYEAADYEAFCSNCGNYILPLQDQGRPVPTVEITEDGTSRTPPVEFPQAEASSGKKVAQRIYPPPEYAAQQASTQAQSPIRQSVSPAAPPKVQQPQPAPQPAYQEPLYENDYPPNAPISRDERKRLQRMKTMAITFGILALVTTAVATFVLVSTSSLRVQLNKSQRENASAQSATAQLEKQVDSLTEDLSAAKAENTSLNQQVADLNTQIGNLETNVNQSQYDKDAAVRDMDELKTSLAAAEESNTTLENQLEETKQALTTAQEEKDKLEEEKKTLEEELTGYQEEIEFYDDHVVFVMLSSSDKLYHRYSCSQFTKKNFLSYSTKLAESNGYTPCPECIGTAG